VSGWAANHRPQGATDCSAQWRWWRHR
jgi:hypothetical protein